MATKKKVRYPYGDHYKPERYENSSLEGEPCVICGKPCQPKKTFWVLMNHTTSEYATADDATENVSFYVIGSSCRRYVPESAVVRRAPSL